MMGAQLKAKWVDALRSGEYEQGHGCLLQGNKYCCLGVLAHVAGFEFENEETANALVVDGKTVGYEPIDNLIGKPLYDLWWRNDGMESFHKHSFPEIASYIEKSL